MNFRILAAVVLSLLTGVASVAGLAALGPDWAQFAPASCLATRCFCEVPRAGALILQPANSWSSFSFVAVGFWMMLAGGRRGAQPFSGFPVVWYGISAIVIGVGSFLLHATLTLWGQFWDVVGMYLFSAFTLTYAVTRWRALSQTPAAVLYFVLCAVLIGLLVVMPETRRWMFAVVLVADIAVELIFARPKRPGVEVRWYLWGVALQATAFAIWIADLTGAWCNGGSLIQGHAVWHLLNAGAVWCGYRYYRSERLSVPQFG